MDRRGRFPGPWRRRSWLSLASLLGLQWLARTVSLAFLEPSPAASKGPPSRREVALLPTLAASAAWLTSVEAALAEVSPIVEEARRANKEYNRKGGFLGIAKFWQPSGRYNSSDLQSFLPTLVLVKRNFQTVMVQLNSPKVNISDVNTFKLLREQNRLEPTRYMRKDAYRTKMWLRDKSGSLDFADTQYERLKRAIDEEDTQLLLIERTNDADEPIPPAAVRIVKLRAQEVVDAIDDMLALLPEDEVLVAQTLADTKTIPVLRLPVQERYKRDGIDDMSQLPEIAQQTADVAGASAPTSTVVSRPPAPAPAPPPAETAAPSEPEGN